MSSTGLGKTRNALLAFAGSTRESLAEVGAMIVMFGPREWLSGMLGAAAILVMIGLPTELIANPFFGRMTPVRIQDYAVWAATGALLMLIAGSYFLPGDTVKGKIVSGGLLSYLAVGCPVCNKIVLLFLGTSGAITFFAPLQIYLGVASLLLLAWSLRLRAQAMLRACPLPLRTGA